MKRYRARDGRMLVVSRRVVTDDAAGVELPDTAAVREHVRLGRLVEVKPADDSESPITTLPVKSGRKKD